MLPSTQPTQYAISKWTARFTDPNTEADYAQQQASYVRTLMLFGSAIVWLIELWVMLINIESGRIYTSHAGLHIGRAIVLVVGAFLFISLYCSSAAKYIALFTTSYIWLYTIVKITNMVINGNHDMLGPLNLVGYVFAIFVLMPMLFMQQLSLAIIYVSAIITSWYPSLAGELVITFLFQWLIVAFAVAAFVSHARHVSSRRIYAQQRQLAYSNAELAAQSRLNEVLLELVSHEVFNHLNSIKSVLSLWQTNLQQNPDKFVPNDSLPNLQHLVTRGLQVINVWTYGERFVKRLDEHHLNKHDLYDVIHALTHDIQESLNASIKLDLPNDLPTIKADPRVLFVVLSNVLENAVVHGAGEQPIKVHIRQTKTHVTIRVRDYGQGIPGDELENIFQKHYRGQHKKGAGLGIGLYLVREFLRQIGGEIFVQSTLGRGSAFNIVLKCD